MIPEPGENSIVTDFDDTAWQNFGGFEHGRHWYAAGDDVPRKWDDLNQNHGPITLLWDGTNATAAETLTAITALCDTAEEANNHHVSITAIRRIVAEAAS